MSNLTKKYFLKNIFSENIKKKKAQLGHTLTQAYTLVNSQ